MTNQTHANIAGDPATSTTANFITYTGEVPTVTSSPTQEISLDSVQLATDLQQKINRLRSDCKTCLAEIWKAREALTTELTLAEAVEWRAKVIQNRSRLTSICNQIGDITNNLWLEWRPRYTSDASTTRAVQATDAGRIEKKLDAEIKMAGNISSALADKIALAQEELKGI